MKKNLHYLFFSLFFSILLTTSALAKAPTCAKSIVVYTTATPNGGSLLCSETNQLFIKNSNRSASITDISINIPGSINPMTREADDLRLEKITDPSNKGITVFFNFYLDHIVRKNEKGKIAFTVNQGGKKYRLSCTLKFQKRPCPFSSFKIGTRKIKFKAGADYINIKKIKGKKKIAIKVKKGYKLKSLCINYYKNGSSEYSDNNKMINFSGITSLTVNYYKKISSAYTGKAHYTLMTCGITFK